MKTIIIYKSHTGFTERYARWIGEALSCDTSSFKEFKTANLKNYDLVIYGGRVHAGKIDGLKKMKQLLAAVGSPKLVIFATGATPKEEEDIINGMWKGNLSEEELATIPHFYMPSGLNYEKMGFLDRSIMKMLSKMLSKKKDKTEVEAGSMQAISSSHDISSKDYITPLIEYYK